MGFISLAKWECDLCRASATVSDGTVPKGWMKLVIEDSMCDRSFEDKALCGGCLHEIAIQQPKKGGKK